MVGTDKVVVSARVNHPQRARETPQKTWLLAEKDGNVCMPHCNCMAGLCEACSHVGALLFAIEAGIRMQESVTCTQEKSRWVMPSCVKEIPYIPVCEMDLSSAKKRHSTLGQQGSATPDPREGEMSKQPQQKNWPTFSKEFQSVGSNQSFYPLLHLIMLLLYLLRTKQCQSH